ncbi:DUF4031 domain-containing protein [Intrasporangium flavum]|uniref:DUF4031 domain-containing protein n=1 Tax=Intrasporangium flavum TaxID=1428657 RepID=UPI00096FF32A|nr:DUF4031 domain-containing protein [Intrasporangium flavum]
MTVWIDQPIWPAHGRLFAHLASDTSYEELHAVARAAQLHPRAFDGDHYDVPDARWQDVVDAGATPTDGADLARRLNASGLRLRKRKRDRGVRRILDVTFPNGASDVDLVASDEPLDPARVLAAMVFVRDRRGDFVVVHSVRRGEWGSPGGWREGDETPVENAVRETFEETGLRLRHPDVLPCGYERFTPKTDDNVFGRDKPYLQVFRTRLEDVRPALTDGDDGIHETRWVTPQEYAQLCGRLFWWPLAVEVFPDLRGLAPTA